MDLPELDCGDSSCYFATKKDGMRTNGGCRCIRGQMLNSRDEFKIQRWMRLHKMKVEELQGELDAIRGSNP